MKSNGASPHYKNAMKGRQNKAEGAMFENVINQLCDIYFVKGDAKVEKTPEPMRVLRNMSNGHFESVFTASAQPDYKGILDGGQCVVFEAKFTATDRITDSRVNKSQMDSMIAYASLGALVFILVGFSDGRIYHIPLKDWIGMKERFGHQYISQKELDEQTPFLITTYKGIPWIFSVGGKSNVD